MSLNLYPVDDMGFGGRSLLVAANVDGLNGGHTVSSTRLVGATRVHNACLHVVYTRTLANSTTACK